MKICKTCRNEDFNAAAITIKFEGGTAWKTDLLEFARPSGLEPLNKTYGATMKYTAGAQYFNDYEKWFYADFPMMYDPCTPFYKSKLNVISELISTSTINIEGGITGDIYSKDQNGKATIQKTDSYSWADLNTDFGKAKKVSTSIDEFVKAESAIAAQIPGKDPETRWPDFAADLKKPSLLSAGLKAIPYVGSILGLFDVFLAGGKSSTGPQDVKIMPLSVNLTTKLTGTLTKTAPYHNIIFNNPGAKDNNNNLDIYPYYNEVLGVFNIINKPTLKYNYAQTITIPTPCRTCGSAPDTSRDYSFQLPIDQIKYVLNPASGLQLVEMKAAIYYDCPIRDGSRDITVHSGDFKYYGIDKTTNREQWKSPDYFIKCFDQKRLFMHLGKGSAGRNNMLLPIFRTGD
jgi:hypothetical protein